MHGLMGNEQRVLMESTEDEEYSFGQVSDIDTGQGLDGQTVYYNKRNQRPGRISWW